MHAPLTRRFLRSIPADLAVGFHACRPRLRHMRKPHKAQSLPPQSLTGLALATQCAVFANLARLLRRQRRWGGKDLRSCLTVRSIATGTSDNLTDSSNGSPALTFSSVIFEDCTVLEDGVIIASSDLAALKVGPGDDLELAVRVNDQSHSVVFSNQKVGEPTVSLNGAAARTIQCPTAVHFSRHAVCIGSLCLRWPTQQNIESLPSSSRNLHGSAQAEQSVEALTFGSVKFEDCSVKEDGFRITEADLSHTTVPAGSSLELLVDVGGHSFLVVFSNSEAGETDVSVDNAAARAVESPLQVHFMKKSMCIGSLCLPWPKQASTASASVQLQQSKTHQGPIIQICSEGEFTEALQQAGTKGVVVDFNATWCDPCKRILPKLLGWASGVHSELLYLSVDGNDVEGVANAYDVDGFPTFLFMKCGTEVIPRLVGIDPSRGVQELEDRLKALKDAAPPPKAAEVRLPVVPKRTEYDVIIIGAGSGGMAAAKQAAQLGAAVAIFDFVKPSTQHTRWGLGGTCVNVGCVPKKLMHYASLCGEQLADAQMLGWNISEGGAASFNWATMVNSVQNHVKKLNISYRRSFDTANMRSMCNGETVKFSDGSVTYYNALARFSGPKSVAFNAPNGEQVTLAAQRIVIACGGRPYVPPTVPGALQHCITSDDIFSLKQAPGKTLCVGSGYIALECAGFLTNLGFNTTVAVRSRPLREEIFDRQCVNKVTELMARQGTRFLHATVEHIERAKDGKLLVSFQAAPDYIPIGEAELVATRYSETPAMEAFDTVLYATGRAPDVEMLNLSTAGVAINQDGKILVDDQDATNISHIYAIGDVTEGSLELTPTAVRTGEQLMKRIFGKSDATMDRSFVPTTLFTPFEYGRVGLSEEQAREQFGSDDVEVYLSEYDTLELGAVKRAGISGQVLEGNALAKLVCRRSEGMKVVGFHFVGPNAGEVTQGFTLALQLGARKQDFDNMIGIHPTDAEVFAQLKVAKGSGEIWKSSGGCGGGTC